MLLLVTVSSVIAIISIAITAMWVGGEKGYRYKGNGVLMLDDVCKIVSWYRGKVNVSSILPGDAVQVYYDFHSPVEGEFGLPYCEYRRINFVSILLFSFVAVVGMLAIAYSAILTF